MSYPHSSCQWQTKKGAPCPNPAHFLMEDSRGEKLACHGHGLAAAALGMAACPLPEMFATECRSGDTWVTCSEHKGAYAMFANKSPKSIRTAVSCDICLGGEEL